MVKMRMGGRASELIPLSTAQRARTASSESSVRQGPSNGKGAEDEAKRGRAGADEAETRRRRLAHLLRDHAWFDAEKEAAQQEHEAGDDGGTSRTLSHPCRLWPSAVR